jgi:hypothetical protein
MKAFEVEFRVVFDNDKQSAALYDKLATLAAGISGKPGTVLRVNVWQYGAGAPELREAPPIKQGEA